MVDSTAVPDPAARLEALGEQLDTLRSAFMLDHQVGLTITYNLLLGFDLDNTSTRACPTSQPVTCAWPRSKISRTARTHAQPRPRLSHKFVRIGSSLGA